MSRAKRSVLTVLAGVGGSVAVMLTGFATTPALLRYIGAERFGAFRAATDWFGYVGLLEFGVGGALQVVFSKAFGTDSRAGVVAGVRAGLRAYLLVAGAMVGAAALLSAAMPTLIRAPAGLRVELWAGCGVYLLSLALVPLAVFRALAEAEQRGYVVHLLNTAQLLTGMVGSLAFAAMGWGLVGQFLGVLAGLVLFHLALAWDEIRRYPELLRGGPDAPRPELWALSWPTLLFNMSGRLSLLTDNILIAGFLGASAVTPFVLTQRMIQTAGSQLSVLAGAGWAGLVDLYHRGEHELFARRLNQLTRLIGVVGVALLLPVAVWNRDFVGLWVGPNRYAGPLITWLAAANAWALAILSMWAWPLMATGRVRALIPMQATLTVVNVGLSVAGTATVGLPGPLIGTTVTFAGLNWWWLLRLVRRELGVAPSGLLNSAARPVLVAIPYAVGLVLLADAVPAYKSTWPEWTKWAALAGWLSGAAGGYLLLAWTFALPVADRREWLGRIRDWSGNIRIRRG